VRGQSGGASTSVPRWAARVIPAVIAVLLALTLPAIASADPGDIGFEGPAGPGGAPSGSKPESKLWFNDGRWWASMYDVATSDFYIWFLDQSTQTWTRTGTRLDDRNGTRADVLWDGTKLYVASHNFSETDGSGVARLYRFSYDTATDTYSLDAGFPATINSIRTETLVIAKDSTGQLWATWEAGGSIWLNRTTGADNAWGTPFVMPGAASVNTDDISSIIAFGGDKVGVFWSNQDASPDADYFAVHNDADADATWSIATAYTGTNLADDHVNLKTDSAGRVYAVVKTSLTGANPLIVLLVRDTSGAWTSHTVSIGSFDETRPILSIDEGAGLLRVYLTSAANGGTINERTSPMSSIAFAGGEGRVVLKDASALKMNNPTTTKQNVTSESGLIVMGYNDTTRHYWHADILGGGGEPPPNAAPTANATSATTTVDQAVSVGLSGSDAETCELAFSIVSGPAHGSLGSIGGSACTTGGPNTDSASVTYTPTAGYTGPDSFTYRVNDGTTDSTPATASLTINTAPPPGSTLTFAATHDAQVRSSAPTTNYGALATVRLGGEGTTTTYRTYLKFDVTGLTGSVTSAKLRLFATDASSNTVHVLPVADTSWTEGAITWNNKPATGTPEVGAASVPTLNAYNEITLSPTAVSGNGAVSFGLTIDGTNSAIFSSSEGANAPQLVLTQSSGGPPPNAAPAANATSATTTADQAVGVGLSGSDAETCQLTFSIVSGPTHGSLGSISNSACVAGSPNTDTASVTYTPDAGYTGPDSFTYKVNDGTTDSATATATLTVNPSGGGDTTAPVRGSSVVFGSTVELTYNEPLDTGSVPATTSYAPLVNGGARGVSNVAVAGSVVTLTLASPVVASDTVTLSYTAPATNPVQDVAGNDAASFSGVAVANQTQPPPGGGTLTFTASHDAQVRSSTPTSNFGTLTTIRVGGEGTTTIYRTYLKFDVSGLTGTVTAVKLRLFATDASPNVVHVLPVADTTWTEGTINWDNKPATGTPDAGSGAVPTLNGYNEITLSSTSVSGNGEVTFALTIEGTNSAIFSSSEGANAPQLVVTHD
jgi:uncharacterized repeat protein (TIGR02059 family)